jgi:hypothetical protein
MKEHLKALAIAIPAAVLLALLMCALAGYQPFVH